MGRHRNSTPAPRRAGAKATPAQAGKIANLLAEAWPDATCELDHRNAYELVVATILSAQSTDRMINTVTPKLFAKYPNAAALARADQPTLEEEIHSTGFFRMKAKSLIGMAKALVERHGGEVPQTMDELVELPGVARKTANVVLGTALGKNEGVVVDTHVARLAQRLGLTVETDPVKIEQDLMQLVPRDQWTVFAHRLIWHGRRVCTAKNPDHEHCLLAPVCPTAALVKLAAKKPVTTKPVAKKPVVAAKKKPTKQARA
ncbi:MAG: endonuclease III [Deltaproteobacteria bacterium]|nr:endonuclease III [Deltaproteobacteria bacterium]